MSEEVVQDPVNGVLKKYIEKDRLSSRLETFLEYTHEFFSSIDSINFERDNFSELLSLLGESSQEDKKKLSLVVGNVTTTSEDLKNHLFMLEKVILNSLDVVSKVNGDIIEESKTSDSGNIETTD